MMSTRHGRPRACVHTVAHRAVGLCASLLASAALVLVGTVSAVPASGAAVTVTPLRTIGAPDGHAGLYAWGLATQTDGSVLVGDYWNFRIAHYSQDGSFLGNVLTDANQGSANNEEIAPELHQSPYGIAVDPTNGDFYFGDVDGSKTVDKYHADGSFALAFGGNGTGPGRFKYPSRVAVGADRRVYVADQWDHVISVHNPDTGAELFSFGGQGTANGQFKQPRGLAFDAAKQLFVIDNYNLRVEVFDAEGAFRFKFGSKGNNPGQFAAGADLRGLAVDQARGWVYIVDAASGFVNKFTTTGTFLTRWGGFGTGPGKFVGGGREVTVDGDGNVWVADMPGFRAQKFTPDGQYLLSVPNPAQPPPDGGFNQPRGVAVDSAGNIFVSDTHNWRIQKFAPDGTFIENWGHRGGGALGFNYQRGIAVDRRNGDVVVADTDNHKIVKFAGDGSFTWEVGKLGTALGQFQNPHSVAVGPDGRIYVADTQNSRIQILDENGVALYAFGSKGNGNGQFQFNRSVTVDPTDQSLWVSDSLRGIVQHFTNNGQFLGSFGGIGTADSKLQRAADVEVYDGNVYVADVDAHKIKVWSKSGQFVTSFGGGGRALGQLFNPHGMDITPDGHLYVVEQTGERVTEFKLGTPDATPADTTISSPESGSTVDIAALTVAGGASDDTGVAGVRVSIQDSGARTWWTGSSWSPTQQQLEASLTAPGAASTGWSYAFAPAFAGTFAISAVARDSAGNADPSPATTTVTVTGSAPDMVAPDGTVTTPTARQVFPTGPVTLIGGSTDNVGVSAVKMAIQETATKKWWNGSGFVTAFTWLSGPVLSSPGATSVTWSFDWTPPAAGGYGVTVRAEDAAGNVDTTRPFVNFSTS